jgi:ornithine cyclodeaminase/alanine dehydrogenase-like protein (mu-crystallin family)
MAGENPRIHVSTAARRKADNDPHDFAAIEICDGALIDIRAAALRRQNRSCRAGADHDRLVASARAQRFRFADLLLGKVSGRESKMEINLFKSEGTGVQFAALGQLAYLRSKEKGLGCELPSEWFIQKIRN